MIYVALSCLQGRPMRSAFDELASLGRGVQLTPGNHPTPEFEQHVRGSERATRTHHGFDFWARKRDVWSDDARCIVDADSVHPPRDDSRAANAVAEMSLASWLEREAPRTLLETMYPGYVLGTGAELETAMDAGVDLAVDVSHVFMQLAQGAMSEGTWRRLAAYDNVREVHVSANDGRHDSHKPIVFSSFGLEFARERLDDGTPVVLECYMHRLPPRARAEQLDIVERGES